MIKKLIEFLFSLFKKKDTVLYVGSLDKLLPPLSKEEELELARKMSTGDKEARDKLIEHNLRLVAHIVKKFDSKYSDTDDLISIGTIGLIKGIDTFTPEKNAKITTYCARCIENEILMYFRKSNKYSKDISINESIGFDKDGNEIAIQDILKTENVDFCDEIDLKDNIKALYKYMDVLTKREKEIIINRYGLEDRDEETQKSISKKMGISRSYVSRIEKRALTKLLREFIRHNKLN